MQALKIWNKDHGQWCIPRKDTYEYKEVIKIMGLKQVVKTPVKKNTVKQVVNTPVKKNTVKQVVKTPEPKESKESKENKKSKEAFNKWYNDILPLDGSIDNIRTNEDRIINMCEEFLIKYNDHIDANMRSTTEKVIKSAKSLKNKGIKNKGKQVVNTPVKKTPVVIRKR
jgi:regulator of replication initiation timing